MLLSTKRTPWRDVWPLPLLLAAFAVTIGIQLVPLPPAIWHGIPGRAQYDAVAEALNGVGQWHPLTLAPDRTWNSLISLLVPFTAMIGFTMSNEKQRGALLWAVLALAAFSMMLGLMQFVSGETSPLYWYPVSGRGQMLGLFANRNHQGVFLALVLPLLRVWTLQVSKSHAGRKFRAIIGLCAGAFIIIYVLVLGSRAGMALTVAGLIGAYLVEPSVGAGLHITKRQRIWIIVGIMIGVAVLLAVTLNAGRAISIARIVEKDDFVEHEGRLRALPTLLHIMASTFPFGTGFGSFVPVYASFEPDSLLKPTYLNNAHNDLIELIITGGLPALIVLLAFLWWYGRAAYMSFTIPASSSILQRASAFAILILLLASLADYPLRTPLLGALFAVFSCWLSRVDKLRRVEQAPRGGEK
ncbi:O-antigen ligase family protein [Novosphingobium album (ex Hu et al. 2023)]|uniref:O-antigen ligase family protein n=1 Tax=Novosphingobium album (ex Hu et al. 2023) TaxID=2930093 RepID=A0ABT0B5X8_9SPHN|nr:O-antigen ligase family protein [Novosphingobium album (ex Hu et al. 2023)]MCJ2180433.1 O-antigen ligase family protein [Novosphingobium album (ex Hu et al. 2023)]